MGAAVLLPVILLREKKETRGMDEAGLRARRELDKKTVRYGAVLGVVLCTASNLQQFAFYDSTSGKIAFITAFYMFFVPLLGLFLRKRVPLITWLCVAVGVVGLFFLCIDPGSNMRVNRGDLLALCCAVVYAVHILLVERFAPDVDGIKLSCIQFAASGTISCILMFIFETPRMSAILSVTVPLLYSGIMSCGLAYTFQIIGQKYTEATVASLIMCLESVFGVLGGALVLHELLTGREIMGCVIMFVAIVFAQVSEPLTERLRARRNTIQK
jgi:drug/metabolite transporter (DMT)-like permease